MQEIAGFHSIHLGFVSTFHVTPYSACTQETLTYLLCVNMVPYLSSELSGGGCAAAHTSGIRAMFPYLDADPASLPASIDPFTITTSTGFMPFRTPVQTLPLIFQPLLSLAEQMSVLKLDGTPGLLASYSLGSTIDQGGILPDLTATIDTLVSRDGQPDLAAVTAAFRDYAFLASAYLLEPCWERWSRGLQGYGLGRKVLPVCLAGPLVKTAKLWLVSFLSSRMDDY